MNGTPTETVYAQDEDKDSNEVADATDTLDEFRAGVEEGDYLTVVYRTFSNGGSLQRVMGHVSDVDRYDDGSPSVLRFAVEDGTGDGPTGEEDTEAALFLNEDDAYRFDDGRTDVPAGGFGVKKWAWTPENAVEA